MNIENSVVKKRMERICYFGQTMGLVDLKQLIDPSSVKVEFKGKSLQPKRITKVGKLYFTKEQVELWEWTLYDDERKQIDDSRLKDEGFLKISYNSTTFSFPRAYYDSKEFISESLGYTYKLSEVIENRLAFIFANPGQSLNEFVLFGYLYLSSGGKIFQLANRNNQVYFYKDDVEELEHFCAINKDISLGYHTIGKLPQKDTTCPSCGMSVGADDIATKNWTLNWSDGQIYHTNCFCDYNVKKTTHQFIQMMDQVYGKGICSYQPIPNEYSGSKLEPWFEFNTPHCLVQAGWRKRVIQIKWITNDFDVLKLFGDQNVTKHSGDVQLIHAWGRDKAIEYLAKAKQWLDTKN